MSFTIETIGIFFQWQIWRRGRVCMMNQKTRSPETTDRLGLLFHDNISAGHTSLLQVYNVL